MRVPLVFFPVLLALALGCSSGYPPPAVFPVSTLAAPADVGPGASSASAPAAPDAVSASAAVPAATVSLGAGDGSPVLEASPEAVPSSVPSDSQGGILSAPDGVRALEPAVISPGAGFPPLPAPGLSGTPPVAAPVPTPAVSAAGGGLPLPSAAEILRTVSAASAEAGSGYYESVVSSEVDGGGPSSLSRSGCPAISSCPIGSRPWSILTWARSGCG